MEKTTKQSVYFNQDRPKLEESFSWNISLEKYLAEKLNIHCSDLIDILKKPKKEIVKLLWKRVLREQLKWTDAEEDMSKKFYENSFLRGGTNMIDRLNKKVENRNLTKKEYDKIMKEIEIYGSILPTTNKRDFDYGHWDWDVIISSTTNKMYSVEDSNDRNNLISDYNWYQYYESRSWSSWAWNMMAWKKTLIYLPTVRKDVMHPENERSDRKLNWLNIFARADRWIVDKEYPITIIPEKKDKFDFIFIDPNNVKDIFNSITSAGEYPDNYKIFNTSLWLYYMDDRGERQEVIASYLSEKPIKRNKLIDVLDWTNSLQTFNWWFKSVSSEFERVIWIYETEKGNYMTLNKNWHGTRWFWNVNPRDRFTKDGLYEYTIWDAGKIEKEYYWDTINVRWWEFIDKNTVWRHGEKETEDWNSSTGWFDRIKTKIVLLESSFNELWFWFSEDEESAIYKLFCEDHEVIAWLVSRDSAFSLDDMDVMFAINKDKITISVNWVGKDATTNQIKKIISNISNSKELKNKIYKKIRRILVNKFDEDSKLLLDNLSFTSDLREKHGNLLYRTYGNRVYLWYIAKNIDINKKFDVLVWSMTDYEEEISIGSFHKWVDYREKHMHKKVYDKLLYRYITHLRYDKQQKDWLIRYILEKNPQRVFVLEDSYAVWNCEPWTDSFMEQYNLQSPISAQDILDHTRFEEMIKRGGFVEVILHKLKAEDILDI